MTVRKTDRRTIMTKGMIKDALLELLQNTPYEKITVTALCKQSEITRATFYLHYNNIDNVLDELLDDALRLTELDAIQPLPSAISNRSIENEKKHRRKKPGSRRPASCLSARRQQPQVSNPFSGRKLIPSYAQETVSNAKTAAYSGNHERLSSQRMGGRKNFSLYAPWKFCRK